MAKKTKSMQVPDQEMVEAESTERMRSRVTFIPRSDIYETEEFVVVTLDIPGVNKEAIDVTLEKNVLSVNGNSSHGAPDGYTMAFGEFQTGDYERSFRLTDEIDRNGIEAVYEDGVLKLTLPKAEEVKSKKIKVSK